MAVVGLTDSSEDVVPMRRMSVRCRACSASIPSVSPKFRILSIAAFASIGWKTIEGEVVVVSVVVGGVVWSFTAVATAAGFVSITNELAVSVGFLWLSMISALSSGNSTLGKTGSEVG